MYFSSEIIPPKSVHMVWFIDPIEYKTREFHRILGSTSLFVRLLLRRMKGEPEKKKLWVYRIHTLVDLSIFPAYLDQEILD